MYMRLKDMSSSSSSCVATSPLPVSQPVSNPVIFSASSSASSSRALPTSVARPVQHVAASLPFSQPIEVIPPPMVPVPRSTSSSARLPTDLPKFQSEKLSGDVYTYLARFERLLRCHQYPEHLFPLALSTCVSVHSEQWASSVLGDPHITWEDAKRAFAERFCHPELAYKLRCEMARIHQQKDETIRAYNDRFAKLMTELHEDPENPYALATYRNSLQPTMRLQYATLHSFLRPKTIQDAYALGIQCEANLNIGDYRLSDAPPAGETPKPQVKCSYCGLKGHTVDVCWRKKQDAAPKGDKDKPTTPADKVRLNDPKSDAAFLAKVTCHKCHQKGHYANKCPGLPTAVKKEPVTPTLTKPGVPPPPSSATRNMMMSVPPEEPSGSTTDPDDDFLDEDDSSTNPQCRLMAPMGGVPVSLSVSRPSSDGRPQLPTPTITPTPAPSTLMSATLPDFAAIPSSGKAEVIAPTLCCGMRVSALIDSGCTRTLMSPTLASALKLPVKPVTGRIALGIKGASAPRLGHVICPTLQHGCRIREDVAIELADLPPSYHLVLGMDLLPHLGIAVSGVSPHWPDHVTAPTAALEDAETLAPVETKWPDQDRAPPAIVDKIMAKIKPAMERNRAVPPGVSCSHPSAVYHVDTGDLKPIFRRQYPIPQTLHLAVQRQIDAWFNEGVIARAPGDSAWNLPILCAPKKNAQGVFTFEKPRICLDPTAINPHLPEDSYLFPKISEIFDRLQGFAIVSAIDLQQGYTQFPVFPGDTVKLTFTWSGIRYMFLGCPFGLKTLPAHFQRVMVEVLDDCSPFVFIFLDDVHVFSHAVEDHANHLIAVINTLTQWGLRINFDKSVFCYTRLRALGHILGRDTRSADPNKLSFIPDMPVPTTGKEVEHFLGVMNYLRDYIPLYAFIAAPLEPLRKLKSLQGHWGADQQAAFEKFKAVLARPPVLSMPLWNEQFFVAVDASQAGVGAILYQRPEAIRYVSFQAKALNSAQRNYPATKRELLAILFALSRFRDYLWGRHFILFSDHKALTFLFTQKHTSYMLNNWADELLNYDFDIVHRPGVEMVLPDHLSRLYVGSCLTLRCRLTLPLFHGNSKFATLRLLPFLGQPTPRNVWVRFFLLLISVILSWRVSMPLHTWVLNTCTASCGPWAISGLLCVLTATALFKHVRNVCDTQCAKQDSIR